MTAQKLAGKKLCFVSVLRAGDGLLQGMLDLVPGARVGHLGMYRDHETLQPVAYYNKLPEAMQDRVAIVGSHGTRGTGGEKFTLSAARHEVASGPPPTSLLL